MPITDSEHACCSCIGVSHGADKSSCSTEMRADTLVAANQQQQQIVHALLPDTLPSNTYTISNLLCIKLEPFRQQQALLQPHFSHIIPSLAGAQGPQSSRLNSKWVCPQQGVGVLMIVTLCPILRQGGSMTSRAFPGVVTQLSVTAWQVQSVSPSGL